MKRLCVILYTLTVCSVSLGNIPSRLHQPDSTIIDSVPGPNKSIASFSDYDFSPALTLDEITVNPSPEALAMIRHTEGDINPSSGNGSLTIPIFDWITGDYSLKLGLRYRIGAYKTDELAGCLGLGWNFIGGGCVTRIISGMPDELQPIDIRSQSSISSDENGWKYMADLEDLNKDAMLDRYYYNCPGGSGEFVIVKGAIIQTPQNDNELSFCGNISDGVRDFMLTTTDGTQYLFTEREHVNFLLRIDNIAPNVHLPNYNNRVTTWYLSKIVLPGKADSIIYEYDQLPFWSRNKFSKSQSLTVAWSISSDPVISENTNSSSSQHLTSFTDQRILSKITSRTATVAFSHSNNLAGEHNVPKTLSSISIRTPDGNEVRNITFGINTSANGPRLLNNFSIKCNGITLDEHHFTYYTRREGKDIFGYANGKSVSGGSTSVIDPYTGVLNENRRPNPYYATSNALEYHNTLAGISTKYEYEASTAKCLRSIGNNIDTLNLTIGLRIKRVTEDDKVTGRTRKREFTYSKAMSDIDFSLVEFGDFVSLSGVSHMTQQGTLAWAKEFATTATFHESSRSAGFPLENATIFYGEVEEYISGTGLEVPIKIVYKHDLSSCRMEFKPSFGGTTDVNSDTRSLTNTPLPFNAPEGIKKAIHLAIKPSGTFSERPGAMPLTTETIYFRRTANGNYTPIKQSKAFYVTVDKNSLQIGLTSEPIVRDIINIYQLRNHDFKSTSDFSYCETRLDCSLSLCDSVTTTKYFPDGSSRTETLKNLYSLKGAGGLPFIPLDSVEIIPLRKSQLGFGGIIIDSSLIINPKPEIDPLSLFRCDSIYGGIKRFLIGSRLRAGDHVIEHYIARSDFLNTVFYNKVKANGQRALPVREIWVVDGRDTITKTWEYGLLNGKYLPTAIKLMAPGGTMMDWIHISRYSTHGKPEIVKRFNHPDTEYKWGYNGDLLTETSLGTGSMKMTSVFTHEPLIGCTSIASPDGSMVAYTYTGGRLASKTNGNGVVIEQYAYKIDGNSITNPENYIQKSYRLNGSSDLYGEFSNVTEYYDGFGLQIANVQENFGSQGSVIQVSRYDALHRPMRQWNALPMSQASSTFRSDSPLTSAATALYGDARAFVSMTYPLSAEKLPASATIPGNQFMSHPTTAESSCSNTAVRERSVIRYQFDGTILKTTGHYGTGELDCIISTDGNGHRTLNFTDILGHTILVRRISDSGDFADTYTINDSWGNPLIVLPPEASHLLTNTSASWNISSSALADYAFIYVYDSRLRLRSKKLPGCEPERYAYDCEGRLAFIRNGTLSEKGRRAFLLYDALGRLAVRGTCADALSDAVWDNDLSATTPAMNVTRNMTVGSGFLSTGYNIVGSLNLSNAKLLYANYYDDYGFRPLGWPAHISYGSTTPSLTPERRGLLTGTLTAVLGNGSHEPLLRVNHYNSAAMLTATVARSVDGAFVTTDIKPSVAGLPLETAVTRKDADGTVETAVTTNSYDIFGRLKTSRLKTDATSTQGLLLLSAEFDAVGNLCKETCEGNKVRTSARDIRGNISQWSAPYISQELLYGSAAKSTDWTGRVTAKTTRINGHDRRYDYTYNNLGFLTKAVFSSTSDPASDFSTQYAYDLQANLTAVKRNGMTVGGTYGAIIDATILRDGNFLKQVKNKATPIPIESQPQLQASEAIYRYDTAGNLIFDSGREITSITYNEISLPQSISFADGRHIDYLYAASGEKLKETYTSLDGLCDRMRHWAGPWEFVDGQPDRMLTPQGYIDPLGTLHAYIPDYQGNILAVVNTASGALEQSTDYYPYGLPHADATGADRNRRKFGAKELISEYALHEYDFSARRLPAIIPAFSRPDPLAEKYHWLSPFAYCAADPINLIDPTGKNPIYSTRGDFLGTTVEGFRGMIYIYRGEKEIDFSEFSISDLTDYKSQKYNEFISSYDETSLSYSAYENIWTHVVSQFEGQNIDGYEFSLSSIQENKIHYDSNIKSGNWATAFRKDGKMLPFIRGKDNLNYEGTVENISSAILYHEWLGHGMMHFNDEDLTHWKAYYLVIKSNPLWEKTTNDFKANTTIGFFNNIYYNVLLAQPFKPQ